MNQADWTVKRWRIDIGRKLDLDTIRRAASDAVPSDLAAGSSHGLLLHEVHMREGHTQIVASTSAAGVKAAVNTLRASGARVKITAQRQARRR